MKPIKRVPRPAALTALTLALALSVTACGSSSGGSASAAKSSTAKTGGSAAKVSLAAYTSCLKSHGVSTKARAGFGGGFGGGGTSTTGGPPSGTPPTGTTTTGGFPGGGSGGPGVPGGGSSKYAKAAKACASKLPTGARSAIGAGGFGGAAGGSTAAGRAAFSTKELDAYVSCIRKNGYGAMPAPSTTGGAVFPKSVASNAKFEAANAKCQSLLVPAKTGSAAPGG
jgi:hypothetical protein